MKKLLLTLGAVAAVVAPVASVVACGSNDSTSFKEASADQTAKLANLGASLKTNLKFTGTLDKTEISGDEVRYTYVADSSDESTDVTDAIPSMDTRLTVDVAKRELVKLELNTNGAGYKDATSQDVKDAFDSISLGLKDQFDAAKEVLSDGGAATTTTTDPTATTTTTDPTATTAGDKSGTEGGQQQVAGNGIQHFATYADFLAAKIKKPSENQVANQVDTAININVVSFDATTNEAKALFPSDLRAAGAALEVVETAIKDAYITTAATDQAGADLQVSLGGYTSVDGVDNGVIVLQMNNITKEQASDIIKAATVTDPAAQKILDHLKDLAK